ncbi:hypothetical protein [Haloplanus rubicundus]|uniref:hypothetical protein n=1 Tax=Haloplanus rubicundus TaxID=1547898 RepID=UPI0013005834|nr:hypothetical protein [Haloplanus rubicundus]
MSRGDDDRLDSVKAQDQNGSTYICIPSDIAEDLDIEPGDNVLVRQPSGARRAVVGCELDAIADD